MRVPFRKVLGIIFLLTAGLAGLFSTHQTKAATGDIWYAKTSATGAGDCTSWADACTLQEALTDGALVSGDEIWVMKGTHLPTTNPLELSASFILVDGVGVYGGFAGSESALDQRNIKKNLTILSCDIDKDDSQNPITDITTVSGITTNCYNVVSSLAGVGATTILDGFTITGGFATDPFISAGGGIFIEDSSPTLQNLDLTGNVGLYGGAIFTFNSTTMMTNSTIRNNFGFAAAGIYAEESTPTLKDISIHDNFSLGAGGMYNYLSDSSLTNVTFEHNESLDVGGGMLNEESSPILNNVKFNENNALFAGGGMFNVYESSPELTDVTFTRNEAGYVGGGIANETLSSPILKDVVFDDNYAGEDGGGISNYDESSPSLTNVTFINNEAGYYGGGMDNYGGCSPILNNVTFENNKSGEDGGGMGNFDLSSPELTDVTFKNNRAVDDGGGMSSEGGCEPTLNNVVFENNKADDDGGGMYSYNYSIPTLTDVTFNSNQAGDSGGGMYNIGAADAILTNVTFYKNTAADDGGAMRNYADSWPTLDNVTINKNQAMYGGGISNGDYSYATLNNVTISGNTATAEGGGIFNHDDGYTLASNSIIWGNSAPTGPNFYRDGTGGTSMIVFSVVQGDFVGGLSIITDDPLLDSLASNGGFTQTMALKDGSSAIDQGDGLSCAPVDQRGVIRPIGLGCDIGAYESGAKVLKVSTSDPKNKAYILSLSTIAITFNEAPLTDGSSDAANNLANYLFVKKGDNGKFDTTSCESGLQGDDVQLAFSGLSYDGGTLTTTLTLNTPLVSPVDDGQYRLFVCGTTSIWSAAGLELNNGQNDTVITINIGEYIAEALPETGFAPGVVTSLPAQPADKAYADSEMILHIPGLDIEMEIVGVPLVNEAWDTTWLGENAGWLEGSAFPTWEGNTILTGHVWDANNNPGPFADLKDLQYGDRIEIQAWDQTYVYEVRESSLVFSSSVNQVLQHEDFDYLTLLTCELYSPLSENYLMRRVVKAVLVEVK